MYGNFISCNYSISCSSFNLLFFQNSQTKTKNIKLSQDNDKLNIRLDEAKELKLINNTVSVKNENLEALIKKLESEKILLKKDLNQKTIELEKIISKYADYSQTLIEQEEKAGRHLKK